jgi:pimeloyl-ACP methyl ester carboxylesterase
VDVSGAVAGWLLDRLESMPLELLRNAPWGVPERFVGHLLGEREAEELRAMLGRPTRSTARPPTVFLPGIMGSLLASVRGISAMLWPNAEILLNGYINLLDLNEAGTGDRCPDVEIVPMGIEKFIYLKLIVTLARETRLYEFPYDWRRHLEWNAGILHECIQRWSLADPERRFVLIGHSMGGMLIRTYLALYPEEADQHVGQVILIGSPLYGAAEAALIFSSATSPAQVVQRLHPNNNVLQLTSNMPSNYQLLPPPAELFPVARPYPVNWDLYDARAWGLPHVRQDYLDDARRLHHLWAALDPQIPIHQIAGCNRATVTDVWSPGLEDVDEAQEQGRTLVRQEAGADSGDDLVPLWSVRSEKVATYYVEEGHQQLPSNSQVLDAVINLIHGEPVDLPQTVPSPTSVLQRLAPASLRQQVAEIRQRIEDGTLSREDLEKLFFAR